jgi:hypothetical protein
MKSILSVLIALVILTQINAQEAENDSLKLIPFQLSFIPPVSSNGMENVKCNNQFSINVFAGYAGGLQGVEMGGFANILKNDMKGVQMSGFANVVGGTAKGTMMSGFTNVVGKDFKGLQMAGFVNIIKDSSEAGQFAGFANVGGGSFRGIQGAGFANVNHGDVYGVQSSGFANVSDGSLQGVQLTGFNNTVKNAVDGIQVAGFSNITASDVKGAQFAGFANISGGDVSGFQLSGFINVAKKLRGAQIGFINYCDSVSSGTPFGFLSIVKHGYHAFELYSNETFYGGMQLKTGTNIFYNILSVAARPTPQEFYWSWGYGVGTQINLGEKSRLNLDLTANHINEGVAWTDHLNLLNKFNLTYSYQIAKHFTIYGGPSFNGLLVNKNTNTDFSSDAIIYSGWKVYDKMHQGTRIVLYPGWQIGMRF